MCKNARRQTNLCLKNAQRVIEMVLRLDEGQDEETLIDGKTD